MTVSNVSIFFFCITLVFFFSYSVFSLFLILIPQISTVRPVSMDLDSLHLVTMAKGTTWKRLAIAKLLLQFGAEINCDHSIFRIKLKTKQNKTKQKERRKQCENGEETDSLTVIAQWGTPLYLAVKSRYYLYSSSVFIFFYLYIYLLFLIII